MEKQNYLTEKGMFLMEEQNYLTEKGMFLMELKKKHLTVK